MKILSNMSLQATWRLLFAKGAVCDCRFHRATAVISDEGKLCLSKPSRMRRLKMLKKVIAGVGREDWMAICRAVPSDPMLGAHMRRPLLARCIKLIRFVAIFKYAYVREQVLLDVSSN